jgi:CHAT domain-containing protein/Tfp pilus assembly protein PilF
MLAPPASPPSPPPVPTKSPPRQAAPKTAVRSPEARKLIEAGRQLDLSRDAREAHEIFERALKRAVADTDVGAQAMAHDGLGFVASNQGKLQTALAEFREALEIWPGAREPAEEAFTLCHLGQLLVEVGSTKEALGVFGQALDLLKLENRLDVRLEALDGIGLALHDLGNLPRAIGAYEKALRAAQTPEDEARIHGRLGTVYRDQGDWDNAWDELQRARSLAHKAGNIEWEAYALADLAHLEDLRGRDLQGLQLFDKAFELLEPFADPLAKSSVCFGRAEVLRDLGRLDEALKAIDKSMDLVEPVRANLDDPGARVGFFSFRQRYYELYMTLLMDRHRLEPTHGWAAKAFEASDLSHSRSLLDDAAGEPTAEGRHLDEIQHDLLDPDTALLAYSLGDRGSFLWVVNRDRITAFDLPRRESVDDVATRAWTNFSDSGEGPEVEELARLLLPDGIEPLLRKRLLISPDGALHQIPFPLLHRPGLRPLIEDHVVSSLPSASYLVGMRRRLVSRRPAPKDLAVLSDPVFELDDRRLADVRGMAIQSQGEGGEPNVEHLDRLNYAATEARKILQLVGPASSFEALGFKANHETAMNPVLALYRMIHITTHFIGGDHPDFTGLMLSRYDERGRRREGLVRASEIYNLSLPAELVVLSACGSGLGSRVRGEGPMGMTRAFLHAGAKRVVVSLWDVADDATTELMARFYQQMLQEHLPPAEALRSAQLSMARDPNLKWHSSRAWGAFVLQGEPR